MLVYVERVSLMRVWSQVTFSIIQIVQSYPQINLHWQLYIQILAQHSSWWKGLSQAWQVQGSKERRQAGKNTIYIDKCLTSVHLKIFVPSLLVEHRLVYSIGCNSCCSTNWQTSSHLASKSSSSTSANCDTRHISMQSRHAMNLQGLLDTSWCLSIPSASNLQASLLQVLLMALITLQHPSYTHWYAQYLRIESHVWSKYMYYADKDLSWVELPSIGCR